MKVITPGHTYELPNFEDDSERQVLYFIHKEVQNLGSTELVTINDGTTNEDVLKMLIDRMQFLQKAFPCRENALVITKLDEALMWLEKRTKDRENRNVEGRQLP
jgi:hypothetical protein